MTRVPLKGYPRITQSQIIILTYCLAFLSQLIQGHASLDISSQLILGYPNLQTYTGLSHVILKCPECCFSRNPGVHYLYIIITHSDIEYWYKLLKIHYYIVIMSLLHHFYLIITSLWQDYCIIIVLLLFHYYVIFSHFYIIITHYMSLLLRSHNQSLLPILVFPTCTWTTWTGQALIFNAKILCSNNSVCPGLILDQSSATYPLLKIPALLTNGNKASVCVCVFLWQSASENIHLVSCWPSTHNLIFKICPIFQVFSTMTYLMSIEQKMCSKKIQI